MSIVLTTKVVITPNNPADLTREERAQVKKRTPIGLSRAAFAGENLIQDRLDKGKGYKGTLAPYSDAYALIKKKRKGNSSVVNLMWNGTMRGSMTHTKQSDGKSASIFFSRSSEAKKAAMLDKKRPFFALNEKDQKIISKVFEKYVFAGFGK